MRRILSGLQSLSTAQYALILAVPLVICPLIGYFAVHYSYIVPLGLVVGVILIAFILINPDVGTVAVTFILYANVSAVAYQFHGVPKPIAMSTSLLLVVPLITYVLIRRQRFVVDNVFFMICFFFLAQLVSGVRAQDLPLAVDSIVNLFIEGIFIYVVYVNVIRRVPTLRKVIWALLIAGAFMGGFSLVQEVTGTRNNNYGGFAQTGGIFTEGRNLDGKVKRGRSAGPIGEKNRYAQIMLMLMPLGIFRFWQESNKRLKFLALGLTGLVICGLLLTFSRGAFVTLCLIFVIMTVLKYVKLRQVLAGAFLFVLLALIVAPAYTARMSTLLSIKGFFSDDAASPTHVIEQRAGENLAALQVFLEHPLLGVGPGHYRHYYSVDYVNRLGMARQGSGRKAHTLYLEIAAESGLFGLVTFLSFVVYLMWRLWYLRKRLAETRPELAGLAVTFFLMMVAYMGTGLFLHLAYARFFWLMIAICSAAVHCIGAAEEELDQSEPTTVESVPATTQPVQVA